MTLRMGYLVWFSVHWRFLFFHFLSLNFLIVFFLFSFSPFSFPHNYHCRFVAEKGQSRSSDQNRIHENLHHHDLMHGLFGVIFTAITISAPSLSFLELPDRFLPLFPFPLPQWLPLPLSGKRQSRTNDQTSDSWESTPRRSRTWVLGVTFTALTISVLSLSFLKLPYRFLPLLFFPLLISPINYHCRFVAEKGQSRSNDRNQIHNMQSAARRPRAWAAWCDFQRNNELCFFTFFPYPSLSVSSSSLCPPSPFPNNYHFRFVVKSSLDLMTRIGFTRIYSTTTSSMGYLVQFSGH